MVEPTTASAIISFVEKLEEESSKFYEKMTEKYAKDKQIFLAFAHESKKNKILIVRTYQETISDAIEACFSFGNLDIVNYQESIRLKEGMSYADALEMALALEEKAVRFYLCVAEQSTSLLATIPRSFRKVAERRDNRKKRLKSLLKEIKR